ncbi:MAG: alpha/beta hydrolase [Roseburia sp.]|nr:alpha/beta hydrolase [Roseburia sp.]MCM1099399.1 alpha/beta hydrolase [Ruminococcus flavefaciens]
MASKEMEALKVGMKMMMEKGFAPKFDGGMDPIRLREIVQAAQERMATEPDVEFLPKTYAGVESEISMPKEAKEDYMILYIHGGGLICGNAFSSRGYASMLAGETKRPVISLSYRLAPENPFPAAVDDCFAVYRAVLAEYPDTPIFLIGESGGGYLSIVTAMKCRDNGVKMPAAVVPYSTPLEFCRKLNRSFEGNEDFTVTPEGLAALGDFYVTEQYQGNIYAEPYYDDMHGLPPMLLAWDENESLAVDSNILVDKLKKSGIETECYSYPHCFHAFATAGRGTPESYEVLQNTVRFFEKHKG